MPLDLEKIRKLMGGKSEYQIAADAGMSRQTLRNVLDRSFDPKLSTVERLAKALGVSAKKLLL